MSNKNILGISMGDMNGIGMELLLRTFENERMFDYCTPVLYATPGIFKFWKKHLGLEKPMYHLIRSTSECKQDQINLKIIEGEFTVEPGQATESAGMAAYLSLKAAMEDIKSGQTHNLLTLPINKHIMPSAQFPYAGHTEYLAAELEAEEHMMLLVSDELRVGLVTGHVPVQEIAKNISTEKILKKLKVLQEGLQIDFGVSRPKIAVLGLNPHSGDQGLIGSEEQKIIIPAIKEALKQDMLVFGPYPADGFFGKGMHHQFDAVLAMYHDQGLIPFKYAAFDSGVNCTIGLPVIRTSPDHGTAYDIAGKGTASLGSFLESIFLNNKLYQTRIEYYELRKNPLPYTKFRKEKFSIGVPNLE